MTGRRKAMLVPGAALALVLGLLTVLAGPDAAGSAAPFLALACALLSGWFPGEETLVRLLRRRVPRRLTRAPRAQRPRVAAERSPRVLALRGPALRGPPAAAASTPA